MARIYEYEIKWTKNHRTGRTRMAVYRMKNGKCVKRLTVKEMEALVSHGIIDDPQVKEYLEAEKELKLKREAQHLERGVVLAESSGRSARTDKANNADGFAPRSPELYAYLDGLYKKTRWLNV